VVEVVGGLLTGSLALLADAGHMLTDAAALALALLAAWLTRKPASPQRSFGYLRAEVLAAFVNAAALIAISTYICIEALRRVSSPPQVDSGLMLVVAVAGLAANAAGAWVLSRGGGHTHDLNTRGAYLHVLSDMLGSVGAILAALVMASTGWYLADPILSAAIALLILRGAWRLLSESVNVLMEGAPQHINVAEVCSVVVQTPGVENIHDVHIRTVASGLVAMSAHVEVGDTSEWPTTLLTLHRVLNERFGIAHVTLQPEEPHLLPDSFRGCSLDTPEGLHACEFVPTAGAVSHDDRQLHTHPH